MVWGFVAKNSEPDCIDDNRLNYFPRAFYNKLQLDLHTNPIPAIESRDLAAALDHVRSKGAIADNGLESTQGVQFFTFQDPDGNGLMVVQKVIPKS
ncbi:hypothetical protein AV654_29950 [Paenibacillus elgii]|uniref:VOC domain-containing protein n=1 Tax=Paenibacillus elgii TaxID=189691 RepID=A0A165QA23_9BACL|nr:hypothetical protein [Paenibacillus elgii]KZE74199.1 hypothetical protein AV654_29950 [Paenibacillus elgii]